MENTYNAASGLLALTSNTTGSYNTAAGYDALTANMTGNNNTASGSYALAFNEFGGSNAAFGYAALYNNTGSHNTAVGRNALYHNTTGGENTAVGQGALVSATTGQGNTALGDGAGYYVTTGSYNIDIGNPGVASDTHTIRIGTQGEQTATFIAGIHGHSLTGSAVVVTPTGELGVVVSSERFKTRIAPMGSDTAKLDQLRPVTFKLKSDVTGTRQYGLIAEEVAKVYPELVVRDEKGRIDGVRYDELAPLLLNEVQKQAAEIRALKSQVHALGEMRRQLTDMRATLSKLERKSELVVQR